MKKKTLVGGGSPVRALVSTLVVGLFLSSVSGCQNYRDQLLMSQRHYSENQYEQALSGLRNLESDIDSLDVAERVRYCYLRGMTDFRLGYNEDARYWLGLAKASLVDSKAALDSGESERLDATLGELNTAVFKAASPKATEGAPAKESLGQACKWTSECKSGFVCEQEVCVQKS